YELGSNVTCLDHDETWKTWPSLGNMDVGHVWLCLAKRDHDDCLPSFLPWRAPCTCHVWPKFDTWFKRDFM
ncbi:hypothetical protein PIB30_109528, partial [Stylosanthes scabra]|nr:hypothetical protein [Stylosanthes scabra]